MVMRLERIINEKTNESRSVQLLYLDKGFHSFCLFSMTLATVVRFFHSVVNCTYRYLVRIF